MMKGLYSKKGRKFDSVTGTEATLKIETTDILRSDEMKLFLYSTRTLEESAFTRLGIYSGMRIAEMLELRPMDILQNEYVLRVRMGKGGKSRFVHVDSGTVQLLHSLINLINVGGKEVIFSKSKRTYQRMVADIGKRAGITRVKVHPHMMRHTCITNLLEKGMPVDKVKEQAGHVDIKTTMIYTHLTYKVVGRDYQEAVGGF